MSEISRKGKAKNRSKKDLKGKSPASSNFAPMSADQYAMNLGFTTVTRSRSRSSDIVIHEASESPTPQRSTTSSKRPSALSPFPLRPTVSSNQGSPIPSSTFSQEVQPEKRFISGLEVKSYFQKTNPVYDHIIEPEFESLSLEETIQKMFPEGFLFQPDNLQKIRIFYEFILVDTKYAEITHVPDKWTQSKIAYIKLKIFKVLNPTHWNQSLFTEKTLSKPFKPQTYFYADYVKAWYRVLYLLSYEHSWFITFYKDTTKFNTLYGSFNGGVYSVLLTIFFPIILKNHIFTFQKIF